MTAGPRSVTRVVDELVWALRAAGVCVSTTQAILVARAIVKVGLENRAKLQAALGAILVCRPADRAPLLAALAEFFDPREGYRFDRLGRLVEAGFDASELAALRDGMQATSRPDQIARFEAWIRGGSDADRLLVNLPRERMTGPDLGFLVRRRLDGAGAANARGVLARVHPFLRARLGERGDSLAEWLGGELRRRDQELGRRLRHSLSQDGAPQLGHRNAPFSELRPDEMERMRAAVRTLALRLEGGARLRARRTRRGRLDPHTTIRGGLKSAGVPVRLRWRVRKASRPSLVVLCDVSDSMRSVAGFLLDFLSAARSVFSGARTFVFVSDVTEVTAILKRGSADTAAGRVWTQALAATGNNSHYGRAFRQFESRYLRELDRRVTLVVLGDGRSNYLDPASDALDRIRRRVRSVVWLATDPRRRWAEGDSVMRAYVPFCQTVLQVCCLADLEAATRRITRVSS